MSLFCFTLRLAYFSLILLGLFSWVRIKADFNPIAGSSNRKEEMKYHEHSYDYDDDNYKLEIKPNSQDDPNEFLLKLDMDEEERGEGLQMDIDFVKKIDEDVK